MQFKKELDEYFNINYKQLVKNIKFLKIKYNCTFETTDLISQAYMYLDKNKQTLIDFAINGNTTLNHAIYIWFKRYTTQSCIWYNSDIKKFDRKFDADRRDQMLTSELLLNVDNRSLIDDISYKAPREHSNEITNIEDSIYSEEFIKEFCDQLDKEDSICFKLYYYDGYNTYAELGNYLGLSMASGRNIVKNLRDKLKQYILKRNMY